MKKVKKHTAPRKYDRLYSEAEAHICLNCTLPRCRGGCDRLRQESKRIKAEKKETHTYDQGATAKL